MPPQRPYRQRGIADLEALHAEGRTDPDLSQQLLDELAYRRTERAAALRQRIDQSMRRTSDQTERTNAGLAHDRKPNRTESTQLNEPGSILAAWTALEALSPLTYRRPVDLADGDQRSVVDFGDEVLPWFRGESSRPKYQLYYQVVLGCVPMDRATQALVERFGEEEERSRSKRQKAPIAACLLDRDGMLVAQDGVAVSSFAWALPIALRGELGSLGEWTSAEPSLVEELEKRLRPSDRSGAPMPLGRDAIADAFTWLAGALALPADLQEAPSFALRVYHYYKAKNPPEVGLLNSFFLPDLARATELLANRQAGKALSRYLGLERRQHSIDLLTDHGTLDELVAPSNMPAARWPSPGGYPLVLLQQAAVNAVRAEAAALHAGVTAVNGPPGTGKTTLLRDIVAACVLDRAIAMSAWDDPLAAFSTTGEKVRAGDAAFLHLYRLDDSLKGHEVVIASSNNKAVENVSKELPSRKAIGRDLHYFQTVAERLAAQRGDEGALSPGEAVWGLIAAVMGKAENLGAVQQALWWDDDRSLRLYLKAARGDSVVREIKDGDGNLIGREVPTVIAAEAPPLPEQAKHNWRKARRAFQTLRGEVERGLEHLEQVRQMCKQRAPAQRALEAAEQEQETAHAALDQHSAELSTAAALRSAAEAHAQGASRLERQGFAQRPGWLWRLLRTTRFKVWRKAYAQIAADKDAADQHLGYALSDFAVSQARVDAASAALRAVDKRVAAASRALEALESAIEQHRQVLGERMVDDDFFRQPHAQWNVSAPWLPDTLHRQREDLFAAALALHRAFIDVAAQKVTHNLGVLMGAMRAGAFKDASKKALLGDLWSTFFLVVPVISTTFASMDRMLGDLPSESIGWLLIDEAGQATPQSAVGALMRAKRAIVVGDPLQIPPVVSLPERLITEVCAYFNVTQTEWAAPGASAQTVADAASHLQAEFRADTGTRRVGLPLLVHRRCEAPMFDISNDIAYDRQMVQAVQTSDGGLVGRALGESAWFDVDGIAPSKWCPAEGEAAVQLMARLAAAGVREPDIYLITPFRIVSQELRTRLADEPELLQRLGVDGNSWLRERVGTIHTFQGKEAEAVVAILGAPMTAQQGARRWACATPNILNVMVSRARRRLYVVGSRAAWGSVGKCQVIAAALPVRKM